MTPKNPAATRAMQKMCGVCGTEPVAMRGTPVCFGCWPGGPVTPPPCLRCGAVTGYYSSGLCRRCHRNADAGIDSCPDCDAWGTRRAQRWLCGGCWRWHRNHPGTGQCTGCRMRRHLSPRGFCRLCHHQAGMLRSPDDALDLVGANRHGQQTFLALHRAAAPAWERPQTQPRTLSTPPVMAPARSWEQLTLFKMRHDLAAQGRAGLHLRADPTQAAALEAVAQELAAARGWSHDQLEFTCLGLRIVLGLQEGADQPIPATDVVLLHDINMATWGVLDVLTHAGRLLEDRTPALDARFTRTTRDLPEPMVTQLRTWFEIMKHGSRTPPRRRPRSQITTDLHLRWALPTLHAWARDGYTDLREITRQHVLAALPPSGNPRSTTGQGLKSIFHLLKANKTLFLNPTFRVKTGEHQSTQPLPVDLDILKAALHSPEPAQATVVALIAFHGLRVGQLQRLQLTDIRDGHVHLDGRTIPLADPVRDRLRTYLTFRNRRWPNTANPHLFINYRTASRLEQVGPRWVYLIVGPGLSPTKIREDRILDETQASEGDIRRLTDLFGLSTQAAIRYLTTLDHPDLNAVPGDQA